jgi:excisionase family DNA binding protein
MSTDTTTAPPVKTWVFTIEEALHASKVSRTRLYKEINAGRLRVIKNGRRTLISEWALRAWLEALERDARIGAPGVNAAAAASVAKRLGASA